MANVRDFGALGDGQTDDTEALEHAIAEGDGLVELPRGTYHLTRTVEIDLDRYGPTAIVGAHGAARLVMSGPGPALRLLGTHAGTADPPSVTQPVWQRQRMPTVSGLEIVGQHAQADGLELDGTMQATIQSVLLRRLQYGVHLVNRNRNVLINAAHIYDNAAIGIFIDRCNLHQAIIAASHISYNRRAGIASVGGDLHNLQITGNDIEYNYDQQVADAPAADIWFDATEGMASEITIASNTIQARVSEGGANVRIVGASGAAPKTARLVAVTGNVLGSQQTNLELRDVERVSVTGNTIYDGARLAIDVADSEVLSLSGNTFGWSLGPERRMNDGIRLARCRNAVLSGLALAHSGGPQDIRPTDQRHGAIALVDCELVAVSGCQLVDPVGHGVVVSGGRMCRVAGNTIVDTRPTSTMVCAVAVTGGVGHLVEQNLVGGAVDEPFDVAPGTGTLRENVVH